MKKLFFLLSAILFFPLAAFAQTASDTINLPPNFNDVIWTQAGLLFTSFSGYIELIVGVILATIVLEIIVGVLRKH